MNRLLIYAIAVAAHPCLGSAVALGEGPTTQSPISAKSVSEKPYTIRNAVQAVADLNFPSQGGSILCHGPGSAWVLLKRTSDNAPVAIILWLSKRSAVLNPRGPSYAKVDYGQIPDLFDLTPELCDQIFGQKIPIPEKDYVTYQLVGQYGESYKLDFSFADGKLRQYRVRGYDLDQEHWTPVTKPGSSTLLLLNSGRTVS